AVYTISRIIDRLCIVGSTAPFNAKVHGAIHVKIRRPLILGERTVLGIGLIDVTKANTALDDLFSIYIPIIPVIDRTRPWGVWPISSRQICFEPVWQSPIHVSRVPSVVDLIEFKRLAKRAKLQLCSRKEGLVFSGGKHTNDHRA